MQHIANMKSDVELNRIGVLQRREIEARILAPVLEALGQAYGNDAVLEIAGNAIAGIARQQGKEMAEEMGQSDMPAYARSIEPWSRSGALELRILRENDAQFDFDVTECKYARMYRELGMPELGAILSCNRDAAFIEGFNSQIKLSRTQTIMQGASHCDFRFSVEKHPADGEQ